MEDKETQDKDSSHSRALTFYQRPLTVVASW